MWMSKCCCLLYLNSYCVYTSLYMHALPFPCTYKNTCHLSELSKHWMSHSARFKNTIIELLETSKDPQISKGVDALKQLFLRKKDTVPRCYSLFRKCVLIKSPLMTQVGQASLVNSTAPSGQHVVKCVLNPRYLPPCRGGWGFNWLTHSYFDSITKAFYLR